jgi:hypothetical protein
VFFGVAIVLLSLLHITTTIPAFPGAEGLGAGATGGRGGRVIKVTTLAASGTGKRKIFVSHHFSQSHALEMLRVSFSV